jgi:uncharacterized UPF0160 family protein
MGTIIPLTIATHSGTFQADEALGVWLLRQISTYRSANLIRTRDPSLYSKADIVRKKSKGQRCKPFPL